jgi:hypothetical protein
LIASKRLKRMVWQDGKSSKVGSTEVSVRPSNLGQAG